MATKADVKRLLKKRLTGIEAARLILQDSWEVDHRREGFLSKADIQRIKGKLQGQDVQEYNRWIHLYQLVDYTLKEANILALEAQRLLLIAGMELKAYDLEDSTRHILLLSPAIVTEKQLEEFKTRQREIRLQEYLSLEFFLAEVSQSLAPQEVLKEIEQLEEEEWEKGIAWADGYLLKEHYPEYWQQAQAKLLELTKAGSLRPLLLLQEDIEKLEALREQSQAYRDKRWPSDEDIQPAPLWHNSYEEEWDRLLREESDYLEQAQQRAKPVDAEELEELLAREDEDEDVLDWTYLSVRELYEGDFSWVVGWVDRYEPNLDEETSARPAGMMQSSQVAIIQDPGPGDLDERGYYKDRGAEMLSQLSGLYREDRREKNRGFSTPEFLELAHKNITDNIVAFLGIQAVIEAVSALIGVQMTEDLDRWHQDLETHASIYNLYLTPIGMRSPPHYLGMPRLETLKIGKLEATARSLRYYKERMAIALGDDWIKEAFQSLEFEPAEADSLAEVARRAIQEVLEEREAQHGQG